MYRAEQMDFRSYLAESMQINLRGVDDILVQSLEHEEKSLELIILKVMDRPDSLFSKSDISYYPVLISLSQILVCPPWRRYFHS